MTDDPTKKNPDRLMVKGPTFQFKQIIKKVEADWDGWPMPPKDGQVIRSWEDDGSGWKLTAEWVFRRRSDPRDARGAPVSTTEAERKPK